MSDIFTLVDDPIARSKAILRQDVKAGDILLSEIPLATALLPTTQSQRCDLCLRTSISLKFCTGCKVERYCGTECQALAWKQHHRKLCRHLPAWQASRAFQLAPEPVQNEGRLLCRLIAQNFASPDIKPSPLAPSEPRSGVDVLLSLLPHPHPPPVPPMPKVVEIISQSHDYDLLSHLSARSMNNHWTIHSPYLVPIASGIFPIASRSLNHSCLPTAVQTYTFESSGPIMHVRALEDLVAGAEITVPYIDPAHPVGVRQQALSATYGFKCTCSRCTAEERFTIPPAPRDSSSFYQHYPALISHVFGSLPEGSLPAGAFLPMSVAPLPSHLLLLLNKSHLPHITERFADASHTGEYALASSTSLALLAMYLVIYSPRYPLIGLHCLEVAKTESNAYIVSTSPDTTRLDQARQWLTWAREVLTVSGAEGGDDVSDESGPWWEMRILDGVLAEEYKTLKAT